MEQVYAISLIFFTVTAVSSTQTNVTSNILVTVRPSDNFNLTYGGANLVFAHETPKNSDVKTYYFGNRTSWDRIIAKASKSQSFPFPVSFDVILNYPVDTPYGEKVTAVEIDVRESNDARRPYIFAGGIGDTKITIILKANNTMYFDYTATFYSSASRLQSFGLLISLVSLLVFSSLNFKL